MRGLLLLILCGVVIVDVKGEYTTDYEGNVRLKDGDNISPNNLHGVLQVYTSNQWTTVCYSMNGKMVTNNGTAAAACRQRGFINHTKFTSASELGLSNPVNFQSNYSIPGIRCPLVKDYIEQGEIFLLRCVDQVELVSNDECDDVVALQCNEDTSGYDGQLKIHKDKNRLSLLKMYYNDEWLPICTNDMNDVSTNSTCRQMGFTHSYRKTSYSNGKGRSLKINSLSNCNPLNYTSLPCLTDCIDLSSGVTIIKQCDEKQYELECRFDPSLAILHSSGNRFTCSLPTTQSRSQVPLDIAGGVGGGLLLVILLLIATILYLLCCRGNYNDRPFWARCCRRARPGYQDVHDDRKD